MYLFRYVEMDLLVLRDWLTLSCWRLMFNNCFSFPTFPTKSGMLPLMMTILHHKQTDVLIELVQV